jgi:hypothetical protein
MYELVEIVAGVISSTDCVIVQIYRLTGTNVRSWVIIHDCTNEVFVGPFEERAVPVEVRDLYTVLKKRGSIVSFDEESGYLLLGPHLQRDDGKLYTCCSLDDNPLGTVVYDVFALINGCMKDLKYVLQLVQMYEFNTSIL